MLTYAHYLYANQTNLYQYLYRFLLSLILCISCMLCTDIPQAAELCQLFLSCSQGSHSRMYPNVMTDNFQLAHASLPSVLSSHFSPHHQFGLLNALKIN